MDDKAKKAAKRKSPLAVAKDATAKKRAAKAAKKPMAKTISKPVAQKKAKNNIVIMSTNMGDIEIELYPDKAPVTVANFMEYVKNGFYDGLIFHRVITNFMIQGGGFDDEFQHKDGNPPIKIESDNGLENNRGTIAMARTMDPNSATSQFFINLVDNSFLNFRAANAQDYGYTVFGKVTTGMEVVDAIATIPTGFGGPFPTDVPKSLVQINTIKAK